MAIDPVCGIAVERDTVADTLNDGDSNYCFCSEDWLRQTRGQARSRRTTQAIAGRSAQSAPPTA